MAKTKTDLILETLQELQVLGGGQDAPAEDVAAVDARIQPLVDDLSSRNVIYIPDIDAIEERVFPWLVLYLAQMCAGKFEKPLDAGKLDLAENRLRAIARIGKGTGQSLRVDYALKARRLPGSWGWNDKP